MVKWLLALAIVGLGGAHAQNQPANTGAVYHLPGPPAAAESPSWNPAETVAPPPAPAAGRAAGHRDGLFWKASSPQGDTYLLGSIHVGSQDLYPLSSPIEQAFQKSSKLLVEIDLNRVDSASVAASLSTAGRYPEGDALWNHITPAMKTVVERFCAGHGMPPAVVAGLKPWALAMMASVMAMQAGGMQTSLGIDQYFLNRVAPGMQVQQLESVESQVHLMAALPAKDQERMLEVALTDPDKVARQTAELQAAWVRGDADQIQAAMDREFKDQPAARRSLLTDRNPHMADAVEQCVKTGARCFVVVGAAHLIGPDGVVNILRGRGLTVERIRATDSAAAPDQAK